MLVHSKIATTRVKIILKRRAIQLTNKTTILMKDSGSMSLIIAHLDVQKRIQITFFPEIKLDDFVPLNTIEVILIKKTDLERLSHIPSYMNIREKVKFIVVPDDVDIAGYYYQYTGLDAYLVN
jgi:hypothetical protein